MKSQQIFGYLLLLSTSLAMLMKPRPRRKPVIMTEEQKEKFRKENRSYLFNSLSGGPADELGLTEEQMKLNELEREWFTNALIDDHDRGLLYKMEPLKSQGYAKLEPKDKQALFELIAFGSIPTALTKLQALEQSYLESFLKKFSVASKDMHEVACLIRFGLNGLTKEKAKLVQALLDKLQTFQVNDDTPSSKSIPKRLRHAILIPWYRYRIFMNEEVEVSNLARVLGLKEWDQDELFETAVWALTNKKETFWTAPLFAHVFLLMGQMKMTAFRRLFAEVQKYNKALLMRVMAEALYLPRVPMKAIQEAFEGLGEVPEHGDLQVLLGKLIEERKDECVELEDDPREEDLVSVGKNVQEGAVLVAEPQEIKVTEEVAHEVEEPYEREKKSGEENVSAVTQEEEEEPVIEERAAPKSVVVPFSEEINKMQEYKETTDTANSKLFTQFTSQTRALYLYAIKNLDMTLLRRLLADNVELEVGEVGVCFDAIMNNVKADYLPFLKVLLTHRIFRPAPRISRGTHIQTVIDSNNPTALEASLQKNCPEQEALWNRWGPLAFRRGLWVILKILMERMDQDSTAAFIRVRGNSIQRMKALAVALCVDHPKIQECSKELAQIQGRSKESNRDSELKLIRDYESEVRLE